MMRLPSCSWQCVKPKTHQAPACRSVAPKPPAPAANPGRSALEAAFAELSPDELSPRQALELIYRLKALAKEGEG